VTKRRHISTRERVALFIREGGKCHCCGGLVMPGQSWQVSHKIPLGLYGADDETNWAVIHTRPCHEELTRRVDIPAIARAKRREASFMGIRKPPTLRSRGFDKRPRKFPQTTKVCNRRPLFVSITEDA
jgi:5-methylcytosine-specific restriction enzyme A